jgi:hypothetical protein
MSFLYRRETANGKNGKEELPAIDAPERFPPLPHTRSQSYSGEVVTAALLNTNVTAFGADMILFYVLITYGDKPSGSLSDLAEGRTQLKALNDLRQLHPGKEAKVVSDYCRSIRHLNSLPKFKMMLRTLRGAGSGLLFIDDLHRIFRRTPSTARSSLLSEMRESGAHLFSLRHNKNLSDFSNEQIRVLLVNADRAKLARNRIGTSDTENARIASAKSRLGRAVAIGLAISRIREELLVSHDRVTLQMVADQANERDLQTATGKQWTRQTVSKALDAALRAESE